MAESLGQAGIGPDQVAERDDRGERVVEIVEERCVESLGMGLRGVVAIGHAGILRSTSGRTCTSSSPVVPEEMP